MNTKKIIAIVAICLVVAIGATCGLFYGIKPTVTLDYGYKCIDTGVPDTSVQRTSSSGLAGIIYDSITVKTNIEEIVVVRGRLYAPVRPSRSGYTFGGWYEDSALTIPYTSKRINHNITLYAKWIPNAVN